MPIIKAISNPQTRQTITFHKLMGVAFDRISGMTSAQLTSWIDEDDFKENQNNPISIAQLNFGLNQKDIGKRPIANMEEIIEEHWKVYQTTKTPGNEFTREQFEEIAKQQIPQEESYVVRDRHYEFDMSKTIDETTAELYAIVEKFPEFSTQEEIKTKAKK